MRRPPNRSNDLETLRRSTPDLSSRLDPRSTLALLLLTALAPGWAAGAILTVGTGGAYPTIQAALTQAEGTPAPDEIRIRNGSFGEHLQTGELADGNDLEISGGWDSTFTVRNPGPATLVHGSLTGRVIRVGEISDVTVVIRGIRFSDGVAPLAGAGMSAELSGSARLVIDRCTFGDNAVLSPDPTFAAGGGLQVSAYETARLEIVDTTFGGNSAGLVPSTGPALGAGAVVSLSGLATAVIRRAEIYGNTLSGGSSQSGAGLYASISGNSRLQIEDSRLYANHGDTGTVGSGIVLIANDNSRIDVRRISLTGNNDGDDDSSQAVLSTFGTAELRLSDSVVGAGADAVVAAAADSSVVRIVNVTVAGHTGAGLSVTASTPAAAVIANTISFANAGGNALVAGNAVTQQSNMYAADPLFVDLAGGDYRLTGGSPAVNAGTASPSGGLSSLDRAHGPRRAGPNPDRGAYERNGIFADGFETGDRSWWHASAP